MSKAEKMNDLFGVHYLLSHFFARVPISIYEVSEVEKQIFFFCSPNSIAFPFILIWLTMMKAILRLNSNNLELVKSTRMRFVFF